MGGKIAPFAVYQCGEWNFVSLIYVGLCQLVSHPERILLDGATSKSPET